MFNIFSFWSVKLDHLIDFKGQTPCNEYLPFLFAKAALPACYYNNSGCQDQRFHNPLLSFPCSSCAVCAFAYWMEGNSNVPGLAVSQWHPDIAFRKYNNIKYPEGWRPGRQVKSLSRVAKQETVVVFGANWKTAWRWPFCWSQSSGSLWTIYQSLSRSNIAKRKRVSHLVSPSFGSHFCGALSDLA